MTVEKSLNLFKSVSYSEKMGIVILSTSKGYFKYPRLDSFCGLYPFFLDINASHSLDFLPFNIQIT